MLFYLTDNETMIEPYGCIVMPQFCCVNSGDFKELQIFIHPSKDRKLTSFKLRLLWGDEPLRSRWMKYSKKLLRLCRLNVMCLFTDV